jgi:hypothetical protein
MDLPDIDIVVQWTPSCDMLLLMQQFGQGARGSGQMAIGILLVDKKDTYQGHMEAAECARKKMLKKANTGDKQKVGSHTNINPH